MADEFRTLILLAPQAALARALAVGMSPNGGQGMFRIELAPTPEGPRTHFITSGWMDADIMAALESAETLYAACVAAGAGVTLAQCETLIAAADISTEEPMDAMTRLGLVLVQHD